MTGVVRTDDSSAHVEKLCAQFLAERADPATVEWALARFVRDKALGFAVDNSAVARLVEIAALLDGVDSATGSRSTGAPDLYEDRGARVPGAPPRDGRARTHLLAVSRPDVPGNVLGTDAR